MKKNLFKKKSPTIILTPELQSFKDAQGKNAQGKETFHSHGIGCPFEDDKAFFPVTQEEWDNLTSLEKVASAAKCPSCGTYLDFDAYEERYKCPACGYKSESFRLDPHPTQLKEN